MDPEASLENLRKIILLTSSLNERSLSELLKLFTFQGLKQEEFLLHSGEYPLYLAYIDRGIVYSYYTGLQGEEIIRGIYVTGMFALPLPPFIYRNPSFLTFRAVTDVNLFHARYSDIQALSGANKSVQTFIRTLIEREWIVNRELHDAGLHVYNYQSRYGLFHAKYESYLNRIPLKIVASYLNIPLKQLEKLQQQMKK